MRLVSGWSLTNHSNSESFRVAHAWLSQHGCYREGFWEVDGHAGSPFDLSRTLLVGGGLLLLSHVSRVWLCATPWTAAHQAPPSMGFSRQEHWSGLPFPSPMHESEKWKWSCSVMSDSATPWTEVYQAPPSMGFSRQEYWSGVPLPSPGGGLLVPYSLSGSPVIKQLMQMVTMVSGQGGRFQSVCFP